MGCSAEISFQGNPIVVDIQSLNLRENGKHKPYELHPNLKT